MTKALTVAGHEFLVVEDEGAPWVALRDLCEPLGLRVQRQQQRVAAAPWGCSHMMYGQRSTGERTRLAAIHVRSVPMFFATLTSSRVRPQFREPLERFQREVAEAVAAYFFEGVAVNPRAEPLTSEERAARYLEQRYSGLAPWEDVMSAAEAEPMKYLVCDPRADATATAAGFHAAVTRALQILDLQTRRRFAAAFTNAFECMHGDSPAVCRFTTKTGEPDPRQVVFADDDDIVEIALRECLGDRYRLSHAVDEEGGLQ